MNKWTLLAIVVAAGVISGTLFYEPFWKDNRAGLLVALSVVAAGTLVRLARGLPFTTPDHYELGEIRDLTAAVAQIMRKLRVLLVVIIATMLSLVLAFPIVDILDSNTAIPRCYLILACSSILGAMHAYVFVRMYQVVLGDEDLTKRQSQYIERAVARRQRDRFDKSTDQGESIRSGANYGKQLD